jgi:hypothetical protein
VGFELTTLVVIATDCIALFTDFLLLFTDKWELSDDESDPPQHLERSGHGDRLWEIEKFLLSCWKNLPLMKLKKIILIVTALV